MLAGGIAVSTWQAVRAKRAEKHAETEAEHSAQVARFLADMLRIPELSAARGQEATALKGILDRAAERILAELRDQPAVQMMGLQPDGSSRLIVKRKAGSYDPALRFSPILSSDSASDRKIRIIHKM